MNVHRIAKFDLEKVRSNDSGFKVLIIHRRAEGFQWMNIALRIVGDCGRRHG
jgi:hypothetical protein